MKTSNVLATVLFGTIAAAAPFHRRALVTRTQVVTETVVVWTTVYGDEAPIAQATTTPGLFFEKPKSSGMVPTPTAIYTPPVVEVASSSAPSSTYVAPAPVSSVVAAAFKPSRTPVVEAPTPTAVFTPVPESTSIYTPAPTPSSTYVAPAPVSSAVVVAPVSSAVVVTPVSSAVVVAPTPSSAPSTPSGEKYSGDITIYDNTGADGACGTSLHDEDMIVALSIDTWGASTYNVMTGAATNPWCGQKITIEYNGNSVDATIMDLCPGCKGQDIDLSLAVWKKLTGLDEKTRLQADWWKSG